MLLNVLKHGVIKYTLNIMVNVHIRERIVFKHVYGRGKNPLSAKV